MPYFIYLVATLFLTPVAFASKGSPARPGAWVGASTEFENFNTCLACHGLNKTSSLLSNYDNG
ncbi:MAG: hypothetical protein KTR32_09320, partial [Granulosicoccus sp.]|nr:hypothetical protein [Granulosicoccus sp.]